MKVETRNSNQTRTSKPRSDETMWVVAVSSRVAAARCEDNGGRFRAFETSSFEFDSSFLFLISILSSPHSPPRQHKRRRHVHHPRRAASVPAKQRPHPPPEAHGRGQHVRVDVLKRAELAPRQQQLIDAVDDAVLHGRRANWRTAGSRSPPRTWPRARLTMDLGRASAAEPQTKRNSGKRPQSRSTNLLLALDAQVRGRGLRSDARSRPR